MKKEGTFRRELGLIDSTCIVVGVMIGSGIFLVSPDIARHVGSPWWLLMVWLIAAVMTIMGAICYGELASMMPNAGGQYVYLREAYSPLFGFLYGWTLFMVIQSGSIAAVGVAFSKFTGLLIPWISKDNNLIDAGVINIIGQKIHLKITSQQIVSILVIAFLTYINCLGVKAGKLVQNVFTYVKAAALLLLIVLGFIYAGKEGVGIHSSQFFAVSIKDPTLAKNSIITLLGMAMVGAFFAFDAWNNITFAGDEVKNPKKNIPWSMIFGCAIVAILYLLANIAYLNVLSFNEIQAATEDRVATAMMNKIFGQSGQMIMAVAIMISTFGCLNGMILAGPRLYYAMAGDGLFFKKINALHPKTDVPVNGLILQGLWACALTLSGTYSDLLDYVIFSALIFYVLSIGALFIFRKKKMKREYTTPGFPILPIIYIALSLFIMGILLWKKPMYTWPGLVIVVSGIPIYYIWRHISSRR